jgi:hypothetical protein
MRMEESRQIRDLSRRTVRIGDCFVIGGGGGWRRDEGDGGD